MISLSLFQLIILLVALMACLVVIRCLRPIMNNKHKNNFKKEWKEVKGAGRESGKTHEPIFVLRFVRTRICTA